MTKNQILTELHVTRERLLSESGGTISGLLERLRADQDRSDRPKHKPESSDNKVINQSRA